MSTVTVSTRSYEWHDPRASLAQAAGLSGIEIMRSIASGAIPPPPIASMLGMSLEHVDEGEAVFALEPAAWMFNPIGSVHGGIHATLLDSCTGCAVHTMLPAATGYTTTDLQVRFVGAMPSEGRVLARGRVLHMGGRTAVAEGRLETEDGGRLIAHATASCLIFRPPR